MMKEVAENDGEVIAGAQGGLTRLEQKRQRREDRLRDM